MNFSGPVCPRIQKKLENNKIGSRHCTSTWAGAELFEVVCRSDQFVVDLQKQSCSCNKWDLSGIPCSHAISAIWYLDRHPEDYVHPCYHKDAYLRIYSNIVFPVNGPKLWPRSNMEAVLPPKIRRPPGRPKKSRRRETDEPTQSHRISKRDTEMRCSRCHEYGHNVRTCKGPIRGQASRTGSNRGGKGKKPEDRRRTRAKGLEGPHGQQTRDTDSISYVETPIGMGLIYGEQDKMEKLGKRTSVPHRRSASSSGVTIRGGSTQSSANRPR